MNVPRNQGFQDRFQSSRVIQAPPDSGLKFGRRLAEAAGDVERLADRKQRHQHRAVMSMPSSRSGKPKERRAWPVCPSIPTTPMARPMKSAMKPRTREAPRTTDTDVKRQHDQREIILRAEDEGEFGDRRREKGQRDRRQRAGDVGSDRARWRAPRRRARSWPSCCLRARSSSTRSRPACSGGSTSSTRHTWRRRECRRT